MRSGELIRIGSLRVLIEAISKQDPPTKTLMRGLMPRILRAYAGYDDGLATDPGLSWSDDERVLLQRNWPKVSDTALRGKVLASTNGICAYCGTTAAAQLDHYLPKNVFGEYSVHVPNLIPSCGPCNSHKAQRYKLSSGARRYAHPFFAALPLASLLEVEITLLPSVSVTFSVNKAICRSVGVLDLVNQQFEDLHLNNLFMSEAVAYLSDRVGAYEEEFEIDGEAGVRILLERDKRSTSRSRGPGHWKVVLLDALLASSDFCAGGFRRIVQFNP